MKELLATLATILITVGYLPQIIKAYRTKSMRDVSLAFIVIIALGIFFWLLYGIASGDSTLVLANSIILLFALTLIGMKLRYDGR